VKIILVLALAAVFAYAIDGYEIDNPVSGVTGILDLLQYDDGTGYWILTSGSSFYGTWFDYTDFVPGATNPYPCQSTEWWFYHHSAVPWDTDQIVVELWNGDVTGIVTFLASDHITALHNAPVFVNYAPPVSIELNFWMVANTTVYSANGLPGVFYDQYNNWTGTAHSFCDTGTVVIGGHAVDALFRAACYGVNLENESWGTIKGLFR
jgi:hypothetical protein